MNPLQNKLKNYRLLDNKHFRIFLNNLQGLTTKQQICSHSVNKKAADVFEPPEGLPETHSADFQDLIIEKILPETINP